MTAKIQGHTEPFDGSAILPVDEEFLSVILNEGSLSTGWTHLILNQFRAGCRAINQVRELEKTVVDLERLLGREVLGNARLSGSLDPAPHPTPVDAGVNAECSASHTAETVDE